MKRLILFIYAAFLITGLSAQTGTGWEQTRRKQNFKDSAYFQKPVTFVDRVTFNDSLSLSEVAPMLTDTIPWAVFGAGGASMADSTLFEQGDDGFGMVYNYTDSIYVVNLKQLFISAGDSLTFNVYYGVGQTKTITDSLFTAPQATGQNQTYFTPNNKRTIPPGVEVWFNITGTQVAGYAPNEWIIQINKQTIRD